MAFSLRRSIPLIITLGVLVLLGLFVGRVAFLYTKIQSGELTDSPDFAFTESVTFSPRLQQAIDNPNPDLLTDVDSDDDPALGSEDAVLTIVEFADFGCPYSREASFSIRALATTYGDKIKYVYRDFPIVEIHPEAQMAAEAGGCAEEQNKFWAFHDVLYQNQDDLSRQALRDHARSVGLDVPRFDQCLASGRYRNEVLQDYQDGIDAGVIGTPTFFFNGQRVAGAIPLQTLKLIIDTYLD